MTVSLQGLQTQNRVPVPWKWPRTGWTRKSFSLQMLSLPSYSQTWSFKWATSKRICTIPSGRPNTSKQIKHIAMHDAAICKENTSHCDQMFYHYFITSPSETFRWLVVGSKLPRLLVAMAANKPRRPWQYCKPRWRPHQVAAEHFPSQKSWSKRHEFPGRWWELPAMLDSTPKKICSVLVLLACNSWIPFYPLMKSSQKNHTSQQINSITY